MEDSELEKTKEIIKSMVAEGVSQAVAELDAHRNESLEEAADRLQNAEESIRELIETLNAKGGQEDLSEFKTEVLACVRGECHDLRQRINEISEESDGDEDEDSTDAPEQIAYQCTICHAPLEENQEQCSKCGTYIDW